MGRPWRLTILSEASSRGGRPLLRLEPGPIAEQVNPAAENDYPDNDRPIASMVNNTRDISDQRWAKVAGCVNGLS